jgi:hypothetical protein
MILIDLQIVFINFSVLNTIGRPITNHPPKPCTSTYPHNMCTRVFTYHIVILPLNN